jgi:primosomal protein N'
VELGFRKIFPQKKILRFDGDSERKKASFQKELDTADIIIATDIGSSYWDESIGLKIILNSSAELTHPHFSTEERLYRLLHLHENENSETIVQTTQPE